MWSPSHAFKFRFVKIVAVWTLNVYDDSLRLPVLLLIGKISQPAKTF